MRFDYTPAITLAPDDGEPIAMMRPEVPIWLRDVEGDFQEFTALVDTGADHILFPGWVADELGLELTEGHGPPSLSYSGVGLPLKYADLELGIEIDSNICRWITRVYFSESKRHNDFLLLGHMGFLEFFTSTFLGSESALDLVPNEFLPQLFNRDP